MSAITVQTKVNGCIQECLDDYARRGRPVHVGDAIELLISFQDYDLKKQPPIAGSVTLKHATRPGVQVCVLGDRLHFQEATAIGLPCVEPKVLFGLRGETRACRELVAKYDAFLASERLITRIPRTLGFALRKAGKQPVRVKHNEPLVDKVNQLKATIHFKTNLQPLLLLPVGNVNMTRDEVVENVMLVVDHVVSLLPNMWSNVRLMRVKSPGGIWSPLLG